MNKVLLLFLFTHSILNAQTIDSIIVSTDYWASDAHGFTFSSANVDSFSNGKLIDSARFDENWQMIYHYSDSFDVNGNLVMENADMYDPGFQNDYHTTYSYNGNNLVTNIVTLNPPANPALTHYTYNGQNQIVRIDDSVMVNNSWIPAFKVTKSYNAIDSLSEEVKYRWFNVMWIVMERHLYNYSSNFRNDTLLVLDSASGNQIYHTLITKFSYNGVDTMVLNQSYNQTTQTWDSTFMETFYYSFAPLRITQWMSYMYGGGWFISDGESYFYDSFDRLIHIHNLKPDMCQNDEYFTYNADGSPAVYSYDGVCPNSFSSLERKYSYSGGAFNVMILEELDICSDDSVRITSINFLNSSGLHYQWSPTNGLSNDTILNPFVFVDSTTTYTLYVSDSLGNADTLQMIVNVKASPPLDPIIVSIDTTSSCHSFVLSSDITNSYPGIYDWFFNAAELHVPFGGNQTTHSLNGVFTIVATANNGCVQTDSLVMNLMPSQPIPVIQEDACNNYLFTAFPGGERYKWVWDGLGAGFGFQDTFNVISINAADMSYYVIVEDSSGCEHWSEPVWTNPKRYYSTTIKEGCGGQCDGIVIFRGNDKYSPHSLIWSTGDTTFCTSCELIIHSGHCSGYSWAEITDADGCTVIDSFYISPNPHSLSITTQLLPDPLQSCSGSIEIHALSSDTSTNCYVCVNDTVCDWFHSDTLMQNLCWGTYSITLYNNGCLYTNTITIDSIAVYTSSFDTKTNVIFPNPASDYVKLISVSDSPFEFVLTTISGKVVLNGSSKGMEHQIDCRDIEEGLYFIRIIQNDTQSILKLLIIH